MHDRRRAQYYCPGLMRTRKHTVVHGTLRTDEHTVQSTPCSSCKAGSVRKTGAEAEHEEVLGAERCTSGVRAASMAGRCVLTGAW